MFHSWSTVNQQGQATKNRPLYYILEVGNNKLMYFHSVLDKFVDQFLLQTTHDPSEQDCYLEDFVQNLLLCILKCFSPVLDFKEMVNDLQPCIKFWYNTSSCCLVSMPVQLKSVLVLSKMRCFSLIQKLITVPSLLQQTLERWCIQKHKDLKKQIKLMWANKTQKEIDHSRRASGGERQTMENFDLQVNRGVHSSSHSHQSSLISHRWNENTGRSEDI